MRSDAGRTLREASAICVMSRQNMSVSYVQANARNAALYIMRHDVDIENPICWLEKGPTGYTIPNLEQMVNPVRMVLHPFQLSFKSRTALTATEPSHDARAPVEYLQMNVRHSLSSSHSCLS